MSDDGAVELVAICGGTAFAPWRPALGEAGLPVPDEPGVVLGRAPAPREPASAVCRLSLRFATVEVEGGELVVVPDEQAALRRVAAAHHLDDVPERFVLALGAAPALDLPEVVVHTTTLVWRRGDEVLHRTHLC